MKEEVRVLVNLCLLSILIVFFAVPRTINYQGKLLDSSGVGVNDTLTMVFRLYTSETGGSPIWADTIYDVIVRQGLFSVELSGFPDSVDFSEQYWLEVETEGEVFSPRERLSSAPYSIMARGVENAIQSVYTDYVGTRRRGNLLLRHGPGVTLADHGDSIIIRIERELAPTTGDFELNINQGSLSVYRGSSVSNLISIITLTPGISPTVSLSVEGLPEGASASFSPGSCSPTCRSTMTISTTSTTPPGTYTLKVIGSSDEVVKTATFTLTVNIPFDYELVIDPPSQVIDQGSQTSTVVTANLITGFPENVTFSVSGLPTGCFATFSPTSCILSCPATLTINTSITTPPGTYPCQITAMTTGGVVRTAIFTLTVRYFNFTLSLSSSSGTIDQGGSISTTLTVTRVSEVTQTLSFSLLPSPMYDGITATLTSTSCNPTCNTTLNITASQTVTPGTYPIDIVATGVGGSSDTIRYTLTVNYFNFTFSISPMADTVSIYGSPCNVSSVGLSLTRLSSASQGVSFSVSGVPSGVSYVINPESCEPNCSSTIIFTAAPDATVGTHSITITAEGVGGSTRTANFGLTVSSSSTWTQTTTADFDNNTNVAVTTADDKVSLLPSSWYNPSWTRRRPVTISNGGSALTDYQVRINVTYDSDMRSDFGDLRFTAGDGTTLLNYWVESYTAGSSAVVWVKVPSVPSGSSTIYMYYGNPSATTASNGSSTFDFYGSGFPERTLYGTNHSPSISDIYDDYWSDANRDAFDGYGYTTLYTGSNWDGSSSSINIRPPENGGTLWYELTIAGRSWIIYKDMHKNQYGSETVLRLVFLPKTDLNYYSVRRYGNLGSDSGTYTGSQSFTCGATSYVYYYTYDNSTPGSGDPNIFYFGFASNEFQWSAGIYSGSDNWEERLKYVKGTSFLLLSPSDNSLTDGNLTTLFCDEILYFKNFASLVWFTTGSSLVARKYSSPEPTTSVGAEESATGTTTTPVIAPAYLCRWNTITYNVETPSGSSVVVDILDAAGNVIMSNVSSGANISSITQNQIRLRATLSTTNSSSIPSLLDWTITYYGLP